MKATTLVLLAILFLSFDVQAEGSIKDQTNAACAGALLYMAGRGENVDANMAAATVYMKRLPAHLHPAIDIAIRQFATLSVADVRAGAKNCREAL
jgi:hypothetical protein